MTIQRRTQTTNPMNREIRTDPLGRELRTVMLDSSAVTRAKDDDITDGIGFKGHAAVFNSVTQIGGKRWGWREQIGEGAFAKTIKEADVRFLINHNPDLVLARTLSNTLRLSEDNTGLATDADLARTSYGEDLAISLERGDVTQMSFAFRVVKEEWEEGDDDELPLRTLKEVELFDVSAVTYPAYNDTDAGLRTVALDVLARSLNLNGEQRKALDESLDKIAHIDEPANTTRTDVQPPAGTSTGVSRELEEQRLKALGAMTGLSNPKTTRPGLGPFTHKEK